MITSAQQCITRQRDALSIFLSQPLEDLASVCTSVWDDIDSLEDALRVGLANLPYCSNLFAVTIDGIQKTANKRVATS